MGIIEFDIAQILRELDAASVLLYSINIIYGDVALIFVISFVFAVVNIGEAFFTVFS